MWFKFNIIKGIIAGLIAYFFSVEQIGRLLFFDQILHPEFVDYLLGNTLNIFFILIASYILLTMAIPFIDKSSTLKKQCNNICHHIYDLTQTELRGNFNRNIRVAIFKIYRIPFFPFIKSVSKYRVSNTRRKTKYFLKPGEGAIGQCFQNNTIINEHTTDNILCIPIKYFNSDKIWGVLSIDSAKQDGVFNGDSLGRNIENIIKHYRVMFVNE